MMKFKEIIKSDYFRLFVAREGRVVLGRNFSSLWLLCAVLSVTFLAVSFSNASLDYLSYKMNDPFINWVDIKNSYGESDFSGFSEALRGEDILEKFHAKDFQTDKCYYSVFFNKEGNTNNLHCRFFADIQTQLVEAILDEDNLVGGYRIDAAALDNNSYGMIITKDALCNKLGYGDDVPPYIYYCAYCDEEAADEFGVPMYNGENFTPVPVPILAVVKRLPTNMDIIGTKYFYQQDMNYGLNMYNRTYHESLIYYIPDGVDRQEFALSLENETSSSTDLSFYVNQEQQLPRMVGCRGGSFVSLNFDYPEDVDFAVNNAVNAVVLDRYSGKGVIRVYDYEDQMISDDDDDFISIHFNDLDKISEFQEFVKDEYKIDIEMSQISAKENFNEVSIMANILSWTMIVFAIVCIILFIVNLMQSYFQKVKRNLGTFKAFGISDKELVTIYVMIMVATVLASTVISIAASWLIQVILPLLGIVKEDGFGFLSLWNSKTLVAVIVIIASSISTIYLVMRNLLKATPGDLIYDR